MQHEFPVIVDYGMSRVCAPLKARYDIRPRLDCPYFMNYALKAGKNILLEGQLGALRDTDNGIYPFVTSSPTLSGFGIGVFIGIERSNTRQR